MVIDMEIRMPAFLDVVAGDAVVERVATGFGFTEGPVWDRVRGHLIFSDMKDDHMRCWSNAMGITTFRRPSSKANGNAFDRSGRLITCEHATSRVVREEPDGARTVLASHFQGRELNSPNDVVVKSDGAVYFTDPTYGRIREDLGLPRALQLDFRGVFRIAPDGASVDVVADDFEQPNGLCFSEDERQLFVNDSPRKHIRVFDVLPDGTLKGGAVWAETTGDGIGFPDGMKIDSRGQLFCTGPGGIHVFDGEGDCLGVIPTPEKAANFAWGDDDLRSLYITAITSLYKVRVKVPGRA